MKEKERSKGVVAARFAIFMVLSLVIGGVLGYFISGKLQKDVFNQINLWLLSHAMLLMTGAWLFMIAVFVFYFKGKRLAARVTEEDDRTFELADQAYGTALCLSQVFFTLLYIFFTLGAAALPVLKKEVAVPPLIVLLLQLIAGMVAGSVIQAKIVNATKLLYPEKRGNVWDTRFQKDWYASCDEAERQMMGQAAFSSYKIMNAVYLIAFIVCCLIGTSMPIGAFPVLLFGALWASHTLSYQISALKLERNNKKHKTV